MRESWNFQSQYEIRQEYDVTMALRTNDSLRKSYIWNDGVISKSDTLLQNLIFFQKNSLKKHWSCILLLPRHKGRAGHTFTIPSHIQITNCLCKYKSSHPTSPEIAVCKRSANYRLINSVFANRLVIFQTRIPPPPILTSPSVRTGKLGVIRTELCSFSHVSVTTPLNLSVHCVICLSFEVITLFPNT
jgi:hypothetical protein